MQLTKVIYNIIDYIMRIWQILFTGVSVMMAIDIQ